MRYDPKSIESKWREKWLEEKLYEPDFAHPRGKGKFYNLMMFPYPSAGGLHIGSVRTFTGVDVYGRMKRMQGHDVLEPIGLDGFGIHSENYALKLGKHPADVAKVTEQNFYRQLGMIGNGFSWEERLETYDPDYYKWTQWIFTEMFRRGLAYRKKSPVNWCPSCMTVLADEQVIQKSEIRSPKSETNPKLKVQNNKHEVRIGVCERCDTPVIKKDLEQWFFRITQYAERLLQNLERIDWSEKIKIAQRNWIGRSEGAEIEFRVKDHESGIKVFTTRPDTLFGATYMVLGPEHPLIENLESRIKNLEEVRRYVASAKAKTDVDRISEGREKTGVELKGVKTINPANNEEIPVWVADYVLGHVGTGAIMAVPMHDQRDFEFAEKYGLPGMIVVCPHYPETTCPVLNRAYRGSGHLVASGKFDGMPSEEAKWAVTEFVGGKRVTTYRLRDWLISRQRYWGPPIPMIFCSACAGKGERVEMPGWYAVSNDQLPVELPYIDNFRPTGTNQSPLAAVEEFYKVKCPRCGGEARRETDVSDTFLDSAWYYLRYPSVSDTSHPWDPAVTKTWLPVDMYIGGAEHAVLHLLYVRFLALVFHDWGLLDFEEPFKQFRAHGLITRGGAKMSKSKGNIVSPDDYINAYGADAVRMYLAFIAPFDEGGDFQDQGIRGVTRFLERIWKLTQSVILRPKAEGSHEMLRSAQHDAIPLRRLIHRTIKKVTDDVENLQYNTAISALMVLLNAFEAAPSAIFRQEVETFLKLLAPFAPFVTEELWREALGNTESIHRSAWPEPDPEYLKAETRAIVVQVNGKVRDRVEIGTDATENTVRALVLERPKVKEWVGGKPVKKFVYVPSRIINIVV